MISIYICIERENEGDERCTYILSALLFVKEKKVEKIKQKENNGD